MNRFLRLSLSRVIILAFGLVLLAPDVKAQTLSTPDSISHDTTVQGFDYRMLFHLQEHRNPAMSNIMSWTSNSLVLAPAIPLALTGVGWAGGNQNLLQAGCVTGLSFAATILFTEGLKYSIKRPRPYIAHPNSLHPIRTTFGYSFPSGHTSLCFATATSLSLCFPKWYVILPSMIWATGVGFSRLYLGVHYPSDVFAGALLGTASALLVYSLSQSLFSESVQKTAVSAAIPFVIKF